MTSRPVVKRPDILYPELSYQIVGCAYDVFNEIGPGHPESVYQKSMAIALRSRQISFREQFYHKVEFQGEKVGSGRSDFLIDEKVIVELKKRNNFSHSHIEQLWKYLKASRLKLAIIINFGTDGVKFKRLPNIKPDSIIR